MTITFTTIVFILVIHFLADFALQTHEQAEKKKHSVLWLSYHIGTYSLVFFLAMYAFTGDVHGSLSFTMITFMAHFTTDFITSRIGATFWDNNDYHNGFVVIGFDQVLHYIQLFLTYILIF